mgnify:CR=1 FL=1|tara:strand:- start:68 stop:1162 length:1095 start_codon:yes stop_codon:yes gene_type:complete
MAYTTIDNPELYFQTLLWSGDGTTSRALTLDGDENMQPDWVWIKQRTGSTPHKLFDVIRGVQKSLKTNSIDGEATDDENGFVTAFSTDGFTVGTGSSGVDDVNAGSGSTYVAWNWKAGGSASSNSNGSITSSVSANNTAGFSIVAWTGDGGEGSTVGHGLTSDLDCIIIKERGGTDWWHHWQTGLSGNVHNIFWNNQNGERASVNDGHVKNLPTSQRVFGFESSTTNVDAVNQNTITNIGYCFSSVKGYSKFGKYNGNGNTNGPFIYTGFKPAWVMTKRIDSTGDWAMMDNKRPNEFNVVQNYLKGQASDAEQTDDSFNIDILSNGFKIRYNNSNYNASGGSYVYMAFAESPFVNSKGVPTMAR